MDFETTFSGNITEDRYRWWVDDAASGLQVSFLVRTGWVVSLALYMV